MRGSPSHRIAWRGQVKINGSFTEPRPPPKLIGVPQRTLSEIDLILHSLPPYGVHTTNTTTRLGRSDVD